jgi:hypothetical protein
VAAALQAHKRKGQRAVHVRVMCCQVGATHEHSAMLATLPSSLAWSCACNLVCISLQ